MASRLLGEALFAELAAECRRSFGVPLFAIDREGDLIFGSGDWPGKDNGEARQVRAFVVEECWRWGEPSAALCNQHLLAWGVPLTVNNEVVGGLVCVAEENRVRDGRGLDVRGAGTHLRLLAEGCNLTNAAVLAANRSAYEAEQQRAYVLHGAHGQQAAAIRGLYTREEPGLFAATRNGDRPEARRILNRVLVAVYHHGGGDLTLLKGFLLELVASMCRSAIEAGAAPEQLFADSCLSLANLSEVRTPEEMAAWVRGTLDRLIEAVPRAGTTAGRERVLDALNHMERHCHQPLTLAETARAAGLSPSRFCTVLKQETGTTFSRILNRMRVDRAAAMIRRGEASMGEIALRCGFADQSYFTRIFRRERGCTPLAFRRHTHPPAWQPNGKNGLQNPRWP